MLEEGREVHPWSMRRKDLGRRNKCGKKEGSSSLVF
jgi:hypothetical protein